MCVDSHNKNRMTHPLRVAKNCTTQPLPRVQKLMTHPLSAPAHPPILFDQSLTETKHVNLKVPPQTHIQFWTTSTTSKDRCLTFQNSEMEKKNFSETLE